MLGLLLRTELANYPGRLSLAIRLTISCTLVVLIVMVFRIPGAALGAYFPMFLPREDFRSTWQAVRTTTWVCIAGALLFLLGAMMFAASPMAHFFWTMGSVFAAFYFISVMTVPSAAVGLGLMIISGIAIWDRPAAANERVTLTLYMLFAVLIGCGVTLAVEFGFAQTRPKDMVLQGIRLRLRLVRRVLERYIAKRDTEPALQHQLLLFARRGAGTLMGVLGQSAYNAADREKFSTALAHSHELVELALNLEESSPVPSEQDRSRMRMLAARLSEAEAHLSRGEAPKRTELPGSLPVSHTMPALGALERNIDLAVDAFTEGTAMPLLPYPGSGAPRLFVDDMLHSNRHMRFAARGALSALLCYVAYLGAGWRGLEASIVTCFLTALTNTGLTRQKQFLRLAGVFVGGCLLGIGSQVFLLPQVETIAGFLAVFGASIFVCAWVAASGPRLAYGGLQMALAYELIHLKGFAINTSLVAARDTLLGIVLGLGAMWLIYDHLWATPSTVAIRTVFVGNLRRIGALGVQPFAPGMVAENFRVERLEVDRTFDDLRIFADAMFFEPFVGDMEERALVERIRRWQTPLRSLSLLQFALIDQIQKNGKASPLSVLVQERVAKRLNAMATAVERGEVEVLERTSFQQLIETVEREQSSCKPRDGGIAMEMRLSHSLLVVARDLDDQGGPQHG